MSQYRVVTNNEHLEHWPSEQITRKEGSCKQRKKKEEGRRRKGKKRKKKTKGRRRKKRRKKTEKKGRKERKRKKSRGPGK